MASNNQYVVDNGYTFEELKDLMKDKDECYISGKFIARRGYCICSVYNKCPLTHIFFDDDINGGYNIKIHTCYQLQDLKEEDYLLNPYECCFLIQLECNGETELADFTMFYLDYNKAYERFKLCKEMNIK